MSGSLEPNLPTENLPRLEQLKFKQDPDNSQSIVIKTFGNIEKINQPISMNGFLANVTYDTMKATYPTTISEIYEYYEGGLTGTLNATITVTYTDSTKDFVYTVVRT